MAVRNNVARENANVHQRKKTASLLPGFTPSLGAVSLLTILLSALWMATWYAVWLWLRGIHGDHSASALTPVMIGFAPLLLWALFDYRIGLLLTATASPLLVAPIIPHGFTQGFGDLFAASTVAGFALRLPHPHDWLRLWRPEYLWLTLVLIAALVSLAASPAWIQPVKYGIKYGLAEIAGYCLAITYLAVLAHELRDKRDFKALLYAVAAATLIVTVFSLAALSMSKNCVGGYGARTVLTSNQAITSTFDNPNYLACYLLAVLPLALLVYLRSAHSTLVRRIAAVSVMLLIFMVQATMSRSGLVGLIILWLGWLAIARWQPSTRMMSVIMGLMLPITVAVWWYPACTCSDVPESSCAPRQLIYSLKSDPEVQGLNLISSISESVANTPKKWDVGVRHNLAQNAVAIWREYPITGVGVALMSNYSSVDGQANRAHNVMLTVLAEQGAIGVLAWTGWLGCIAAVFWRARRKLLEPNSPLAFLALSFLAMVVQSLFMDHYRMIWLWQLGALILATPLIMATSRRES